MSTLNDFESNSQKMGDSKYENEWSCQRLNVGIQQRSEILHENERTWKGQSRDSSMPTYVQAVLKASINEKGKLAQLLCDTVQQYLLKPGVVTQQFCCSRNKHHVYKNVHSSTIHNTPDWKQP